jgi:hypothetical protein
MNSQSALGSRTTRNHKRGLLLNLLLAKHGEVPPELNARFNRTARRVNAPPLNLSAAPCLRFCGLRIGERIILVDVHPRRPLAVSVG